MSERHEPGPDLADEEVSRAYQALAADEVPAALDQRVIGVARAAVARRRTPRWLQWSAPLALAASVMVVVAVVLDPSARKEAALLTPVRVHSGSSAPAVESAQDSAAPVSAPALQPPAKKLEQGKSAEPGIPNIDVTARRREESLQETPVAVSSVVPEADSAFVPPQVDTPVLDSAAERRANSSADVLDKQQTEAHARGGTEAVTSTTSQRPLPPAVAAPARAGALEEAVVTAAKSEPTHDAKLARWLRKIHRLQAQGREERAAREIAKLRTAYPDLDVERELERIEQQENSPR
jgi:hypothetical protein